MTVLQGFSMRHVVGMKVTRYFFVEILSIIYKYPRQEAHVPLARGRKGIPPFSFPNGLCNDALPS